RALPARVESTRADKKGSHFEATTLLFHLTCLKSGGTGSGAHVAIAARRRRAAPLGKLLAAVPAAFAITCAAWGQAPPAGPPTGPPTGTAPPAGPPVAADLKAALDKADMGSPADLVKLADSGRTDAQFYAGVLYIFGRGGTARDPARGCA